jgi:hypothetical protein
MRIRTVLAVVIMASGPHRGLEASDPISRVEIRRPTRFGVAPKIDLAAAHGPELLALGASGEVEIHLPPGSRTINRVKTDRDVLGSGASQASTPEVDQSFLAYDSDDNLDLLGVRWRPPDSNGDVGVDYYVQWNNKGFKVFHKSDGSLVGCSASSPQPHNPMVISASPSLKGRIHSVRTSCMTMCFRHSSTTIPSLASGLTHR